MCDFVKSAVRIVAPIIGFAFGGPAGAAIGGALGGAAGGGGFKGALFGAAGGWLGGSALQSGGIVGGEGFGAFADSAGNAISSLAGGGGEAMYLAGSPDPIQLIDELNTIGGGLGAEAGAQTLGYASTQEAVANAASWAGGAMTPAMGGGGGVGATPDASMGGMVSKLGQGVSPGDLLKQATRGMLPGTGGGMSPWSLAQGAYGIYNAERLKNLSKEMAAQADPNAPYRAARAAELDALSRDPSSITQMPGYKARMQAVERRGAAQGWQGSGNMAVALADAGGDFYNQEIQRLAQLSGAGVSPAVAPAMRLEGNINALNLQGQSINRFAYGATR